MGWNRGRRVGDTLRRRLVAVDLRLVAVDLRLVDRVRRLGEGERRLGEGERRLGDFDLRLGEVDRLGVRLALDRNHMMSVRNKKKLGRTWLPPGKQ